MAFPSTFSLQLDWFMCQSPHISGEYNGDIEKMKREENIMPGHYMKYNPSVYTQSEAARGNDVL